jgi:hypothetical protein
MQKKLWKIKLSTKHFEVAANLFAVFFRKLFEPHLFGSSAGFFFESCVNLNLAII